MNLTGGRRAALARMTSTCAVMRKTGDSTTVDGFKVPEWATVHASLPCRLSGATSGASQSRTIRPAELSTEVAVRVLHLPFDTADLANGDLVEISAGESAGAVLRIIEASMQDQATARRLSVVSAPRPEEWA